MTYNFCIVTQPRSGDEMLISKLRSHPNVYITLGKPYCEFLSQTKHKTFADFLEQYKFEQQNYNIKYNEQDITHSLNTREYMESYYDEQIQIGSILESERPQITSFLNLIYSKDKEQKKDGYKLATDSVLRRYRCYGTTIYGNHILNNRCLDNILDTDVKYIVLLRKNILWQYVSTLFPISTNDQGYTKIIDSKFEIHKKDIDNFINNTIAERKEILNFIERSRCRYIEVYYEELAKKNRETIDRIQLFLGIPQQKNELYGINPDNIYEETRPLEAIITNYKELREQYKDTDTYKYFTMAEESINPFYYEIRKPGTFKSLDFLREMSVGKP